MRERAEPEAKVLVVQTLGRLPVIRIIAYDEQARDFVRTKVKEYGVLLEDRAISSSAGGLGSSVDAFLDRMWRTLLMRRDRDEPEEPRDARPVRDVFHLQIDERYDQIAVEAWIRQWAEQELARRRRERTQRVSAS